MAASTVNNNSSAQDQPRISVLIVTYNSEAYLQKCLDSIYSQAYKAIDIVIIDGKSTDSTVQIIKDNATHIHFWQSEPDTGVFDAMNKAIKHITGQWVYFLGSDDVLLPEFSDMALLLQDDNTIYYGNVLVDGIKRSGLISPYYMAKGGIYHQSIIYPKAVFDSYNYNLRYKIVSDCEMNMRLYKNKRFRFVYIDKLICKYNPAGISGKIVDEEFEQDKTRIILTNFGFKVSVRYLFRLMKAKIVGRDNRPKLPYKDVDRLTIE